MGMQHSLLSRPLCFRRLSASADFFFCFLSFRFSEDGIVACSVPSIVVPRRHWDLVDGYDDAPAGPLSLQRSCAASGVGLDGLPICPSGRLRRLVSWATIFYPNGSDLVYGTERRRS